MNKLKSKIVQNDNMKGKFFELSFRTNLLKKCKG